MPQSKPSKSSDSSSKSTSSKPRKKRAYNSPVREQQIAETIEKIIVAGAELIRRFDGWDWKNLNALAVAKRAGVGKRTVQRYFPTEKLLRDAVLQRLVQESGVHLEDITLANYGNTLEKIFRYLQSFALNRDYPYDPTMKTLDQQGRNMLFKAVADTKPDWSEAQQIAAAAMLDIFWQPPLFERLTTAWGMDIDQSAGIVKWLVDAIETAILNDQFPDLASDNT